MRQFQTGNAEVIEIDSSHSEITSEVDEDDDDAMNSEEENQFDEDQDEPINWPMEPELPGVANNNNSE